MNSDAAVTKGNAKGFDHASLADANNELRERAASDIVRWVLERTERPMVTTSFGTHAAVLLDLVTRIRPDIPVVWVDHGFNTNATYRFARTLIKRLDLNMKIYSPKETAAWITTKLGGVPDIGEPGHAEFTRRVKLEPFERALAELNP